MARTRAAVLAAGRELLAAEGPEAVTHLRVGEATGIARTTIYRHWPDQDALLAFVLSDGDGEPEGPDTGDLRGDLHLYLAGLTRGPGGRRARHGLAHVLARAEHGERFAELRRERVDRLLGPLRRILERGVERGDLTEGTDVDDAAVDLVAPFLFRRFFLGERPTDEQVDTAVDRFLDRYGP